MTVTEMKVKARREAAVRLGAAAQQLAMAIHALDDFNAQGDWSQRTRAVHATVTDLLAKVLA